MLVLAVGQNIALMCPIWCDTHRAGTTTGCQHQEMTPPSVTGVDSCTYLAVAPMTFVREDVRRGTSGSAAQDAVVVRAVRFAPPASSVGTGHKRRQQALLGARPPAIALRI